MSSKTPIPTTAAPIKRPAAKPSLSRVNASSLQRTANSSTPAVSPAPEKTDEKKKKTDSILQRLASSTTPAHHTAEADDPKKKDPLLQRKANGQASPGSIPQSVNHTLNSPGAALDSGTRSHMEPLFGRDFSNVRVHNDSQAAASARDVDARAYTVGDHIAFAGGEYQPHNPEGQALLAHELAHTVQQSGLQRQASDLSVDTDVNSPREREANAAAALVMKGSPAALASGRSPSVLSRAAWGPCPAGEVKSGHTKITGEYDEKVYDKAERTIAEYFGKKRGPSAYLAYGNSNQLSNYNPVSLGATDTAMVRAAQGKVDGVSSFSNKQSNVFASKQILTDPQTMDKSTKADLVKGSNKEQPTEKDAIKTPDLLDFSSKFRDVYDVTSKDNAASKATIIDNYLNILNGVKSELENKQPEQRSVKEWTAGISLDPINPLTISANIEVGKGKKKTPQTIQICFGSTDFAAYPGVISYEPIILAAGAVDPATLTEDYEVDAGTGTNVVFKVPPATAGKSTKFALDGPNQAAAESLKAKGVVFKMLNRTDKYDRKAKANVRADTIDAEVAIDKIPLQGFNKGGLVRFTVDPATRKLNLKPHKVQHGEPQSVDLKMLSAGRITTIGYDDQDGITGEAEISPSIKLLKDVKLTVEFGPEKLILKSKIPTDKLKVPIPGFKVTTAELGFEFYPNYVPSGHLAFTIGPGGKNWVDGDLLIKAEGGAFVATGDVTAHVPGMDAATGNVTYRYVPDSGGAWTGEIVLKSSSIKGVKNAEITLKVDDKGVDLQGGITVGLPGAANEFTLKARKDSDGHITLGGGATFNVPVKGVDPVELAFSYDIDRKYLYGHGSTGFEVKGLKGHITVFYDNGNIHGKGSLHVEKGRVKGDLDPVEMDEHGKFSGKGSLQFMLTKDLQTTISVELTKEQEVILSGEIAFTKPIKLFDKLGGAKELFSVDITIPIPGLSIGIVGINGHIGGSLSLGYNIGPAVLRNLKISGTIKPLEEDTDAEVAVHGEFYVPAWGKIMGEVHAGIGVDALVAGVDGNIGITATAKVGAEIALPFDATYKNKVFSADLDFKMDLGVSLTLDLIAYIVAYAGISVFKVETRWDWPIASITYAPPGLQASVRLLNKLHYDTENGIRVPSLSDFQWDKPSLDPKDLVGSTMSSSTPAKSEKS